MSAIGRNIVVMCCLGLAVLVAGCAQADQTTPNTNGVQSILPDVPPEEIIAYAQLADDRILAQGQTIYEAQCAACHGANGEGQFPQNPTQPDSTGRIGAPPHTGDGHTWHHDDDLLIRYVLEGGQGDLARFYPMPAFGDVLTIEEVDAVLAYIKSMWSEEQRLIQAERTLLMRAQNP